jgi:3-dehydroquinate synthase
MTNTRTITVDLGERSYPIVIGRGLLGGVFDLCHHIRAPDCLVVTNDTVAPLYLDALLERLPDKQVHAISLPDGEAYKTLETVEDILDTLVDNGANRDTTLIALGGGVVGDITGFAAARQSCSRQEPHRGVPSARAGAGRYRHAEDPAGS